MNKTKIEWCDYTVQVITGCENDCHYCYARRIANQLRNQGIARYRNGFKPTFHPEDLDKPKLFPKGSKVFISSMGEVFGEWVKEEWQQAVFDMVKKYNKHTYLVLTKCPEGMKDWVDTIDRLQNLWIGVTCDNKYALHRVKVLQDLPVSNLKFISFEPLLGRVSPGRIVDIDGKINSYLDKISWVIIGAQTKPQVQPMWSWVIDIIKDAKIRRLPIFLKDNLIVKEGPRYQQYPEPQKGVQ